MSCDNNKIDWDSLDICWEEEYKEDYGHLFSDHNRES